MSLIRKIAWFAMSGMLLAGCAGGGSATSVSPAQNPASSARQPLSTTTASATLYLANDQHTVSAYDLNAHDPATPSRTFKSHPNAIGEVINGLATAPDGKLGILETYTKATSNGSSSGCRTVIEPADAATTPPVGQRTYLCRSGLSNGVGIARGANGFDLLYSWQNGTTLDKTFYLQHLTESGIVSSETRLPYQTSNTWSAMTVAGDGSDLVGHSNNGKVRDYAANSADGSAGTLAVTAPVGGPIDALATGPDQTLYVAAGPTTNQYIYAYPLGATSPARTLGPFTNDYVSAMAVDSQNQLYVGFVKWTQTGQTRVCVYPSDANGNQTTAPSRVITPSGQIVGLAIWEP
jgi:hypothetical protein